MSTGIYPVLLWAREKMEDKQWNAVVKKDKNFSSSFVYAVKTTGVYCRPGCSSRQPKRDNVEFFPNSSKAENAGYRPCLRCRPDAESSEERIERKIVQACRWIESSEEQVSLKDLAEGVGLSNYHFHRLFKRIVGVTPKQYSLNHRAGKFAEIVTKSPSVTDAIYGAGYNSSSVAYTEQKKRYSMTPKDLRKGGEGMTITYGVAECYLGWVLVAATDGGVCAVELADAPGCLPGLLEKRFPKAQLVEADEGFTALLNQVVEYMHSPHKSHAIPLDIQGTVFQQKVWSIIQRIEPGKTMSYTEVAEKLGQPRAVRAVATACAANKIAVVIPCHRVITKDGKISGYRWGVERKKLLLGREKKVK